MSVKDDQLIYCGPAKDFDPQLVTDDKCFELDLSDGCYTVLPGLINTHVHLDLELPEHVVVENVHLSDSLMQLSYNIANRTK